MKYTQAPVGFRLELFAAEPQIVNPIYMQWDERGRLWVAESVDYPNEIKEGRKGNDSIKILEDTDGDGKCDKVKIFADGLNIPTSFTFARGGIIVAHAPEFIFFKDTNGDDKADVREVLFTGFGVGDTHAGPSNLRFFCRFKLHSVPEIFAGASRRLLFFSQTLSQVEFVPAGRKFNVCKL